MSEIVIRPPYLIFVGTETRPTYVKTGLGLVDWRPELCKGQLRLSDDAVDLGLPDLGLGEALGSGVNSLVIGTAAVGGGIPEEWVETLVMAAELGIDIVAGLHSSLDEVKDLRAAADRSGANLVNVRTPPENLPVGTGKKRSGKRVLMVGTDCAVGKKYTALQLEKDMKKQGMNADFRASGQTGILIAGRGIPIDSVVSDFVAGAAEVLSPDNSADHWDVIEGQGGLFHPGYAPVTVGLLLGSQPDAFVVCHEAGRNTIEGWDEYQTPSIAEVIERTKVIGALTNPDIECVGVSVNTSPLKPENRTSYLSELSAKLGLPCVDPLHTGTGSIVGKLQAISDADQKALRQVS